MCKRIEELKKQKEQLISENKKKESFFHGIRSHVEKLRDIVHPLQDQLSKVKKNKM